MLHSQTPPEPLRFALIRGGTSRGAYFADDDLPGPGDSRDEAILSVFRGETGTLADGVGGENPVLRKTAVVGLEGLDGKTPVIAYEFAQVNASLDALDRTVECGNIAFGVPLFAARRGLTPPPTEGARVLLRFVNSGQMVSAHWRTVSPSGGGLRLSFPGAVDGGIAAALPLGDARAIGQDDGSQVAYSVVRGLNTYLILRSADLGVDDPLQADRDTDELFRRVRPVFDNVVKRLRGEVALKVCLVAGHPDNPNAMRVCILYPLERRLHPGIAVTGAMTIALARSIPGTTAFAGPASDASSVLDLHHRSGVLSLDCEFREDGLLSAAALDRSCRLIIDGDTR